MSFLFACPSAVQRADLNLLVGSGQPTHADLRRGHHIRVADLVGCGRLAGSSVVHSPKKYHHDNANVYASTLLLLVIHAPQFPVEATPRAGSDSAHHRTGVRRPVHRHRRCIRVTTPTPRDRYHRRTGRHRPTYNATSRRRADGSCSSAASTSRTASGSVMVVVVVSGCRR